MSECQHGQFAMGIDVSGKATSLPVCVDCGKVNPHPRQWSLPPEPGPEVKVVRSKRGLFARRESDCPDADLWYTVKDGVPECYYWDELFVINESPLTDATSEVG